MDMKTEVLFGSSLSKNPLVSYANPLVAINGVCQGTPKKLQLTEDIFSKHLLFIGGTGSGKTKAIFHIVAQLKKRLSSKDIMIIFDTKGDYHKQFGHPGDLIIGNSRQYRQNSENWNIFKEIVSDGWDPVNTTINAQEVSWSIFKDSIEKSKDPFFPNAARDLFAAILLCLIKNAYKSEKFKKMFLYNNELIKAFSESSIQDIKRMVESQPSLSSVLSYIGDGDNNQALGVYAEMMGTIRKLFIGVFAEKGMFSMRDFVRRYYVGAKGGQVLFIEYDMAIGQTLTPIYTLLFDLALQEALGRNHPDGNMYLICDEFRLIPHLKHIDDAVNFGRELGVKIIAGLQSINQLTEVYGESRGKNIAAGFSTVFSFRANDTDTRKFTSDLYGKNLVLESRKNISGQIEETTRATNVVEDWDMIKLDIGEAVVGFPGAKPFQFRFDLFK